MRLNAMNSIAESYPEAVRVKLEQIAGILKNNANVKMEKEPSNEEQRKAMANPVEFQNLLGTAVIHLPDKQKIYYRFPYPLPNGAFLLKGELRTPGFFIPFASLKEPLDLEKSQVWAGEIYRLNGTIKWLRKPKNQNKMALAEGLEELQQNLMKWEPKQNVRLNSKYRPNFPLVDRTNPLNEAASIREIRFPTYPSKTDEYFPKDIPERAKVHKSHVGRVCSLETSDDKPGEVLYLAQDACVKIKNEESQIISKEPKHLFSYPCSLVPFIQHNKPIRAIIGGRELKQALPLLNPKIPLVCTGVEEEVAEESGRVIRARNPGKVIKVNWKTQGGEIQVRRDSDGEVDHYHLADYCHVHSGEFQGGCYYEKQRVDNQQQVIKGKILAEGCGVKDGKLALGVNLLVAYMPWFGYNFEDAIVISERAAKLLTSVHVYEEKDERDPEEIRVKVKKGERIKYGTELIGDKITNRHGNKGVISLILPESEMPYFYVNGKKRVIDVILNPTSVLSRVNLGQVLETHFSWVIHEIERRDDLNEFRDNRDELKNIGAPFKEVKKEQLNLLKDLLVKTGLSEYGKAEVCRAVVNGEKEKLGSYVVGYQYFVKLRHLARDKLIAAGKTEKRDPWSSQPERGNSISEFGIWALIAHKADSLAQELLTIRCDDIKGSDLRPGESLKVFYPESLRLIVQFLRGLELEVEAYVPKNLKNSNSFSVKDIYALKLRPGSSEEMERSFEKLIERFLSTQLNRLPQTYRQTLEDFKTFQNAKTISNALCILLSSSKSEINILKKDYKDSLNKGSFKSKDIKRRLTDLLSLEKKARTFIGSFIKFEEPISHPLFPSIKLNEIYEIPENFRPYNRADEEYELTLNYNKLKTKKDLESLRKLIKGVEVKKFNWENVPGKDNEKLIYFLEEEITGLTCGKNAKIEKSDEGMAIRISCENNFLSLNLNPEKTKVALENAGIKTEFTVKTEKMYLFSIGAEFEDDLNKGTISEELNTIFKTKGFSLSENATHRKEKDDKWEINGGEKIYIVKKEKGKLNIFKGKLKIYGKEPRAGKGILDFLKGKKGLFREGSLGKRLNYSAMAVIVPDPELKINEIRLPDVVWKELELKENEPILAVRHPVLHRYGTLAFYPKKRDRDDSAIGIPPLLCKGFGADFDGDTMMVFRAISNEAQNDLKTLLPTNHLFSSANGKLNLHLTQDFILGKLGSQNNPINIKNSLEEEFKKAISNSTCQSNEQKIFELQKEILGDASRSGISVGIFDIQEELVNHFTNIDITEQELKNFFKEYPQNPLCLMALSKARGKLAQLREMVGQIGMVKMSGTETGPIHTNFLNGLPSDDYYVYAQFARDILYQSSRAPQDPGAALREYHNKAGIFLITEHDCGTNEGINLTKKYLLGRVPVDNNTGSQPLTEDDLTGKNDAYELKVRSPLCCQSKSGICKMCYGCDLSSKKLPEEGWRVGAISVQSILENLYQAELKVIHKDPQKDWGNKVKEFEEALVGYLFNIDNAALVEKSLNKGTISEELNTIFKTKGFPLSENATHRKEKDDKWEINGGEKIYIVKKEKGKLNIFKDKFERLMVLQKLELNVDSRHFEVLLRAEGKEKEEEQGWLSRASRRDAPGVLKQAFEKPLEDKLKDFISRLLLGRNPGQIPPEYSNGKWAPLADLLPGQKDTPEKPPPHKQIWSAFYLDEKTVVFIKRDKREKNIEKLKKAIADKTWPELEKIANNKKVWIEDNIETRYCENHAIVGYDGKEIPLQQLFKLKKRGRPEEQLHKDIRKWLSTIPKENLLLSFRELAKRFKNDCPKYNSESDENIKNKLSDIFKEQLKKDFPAWLDTIPEENLSISTEELVEQFKKVYPKYSKMKTNTIMDIDTVKEHIKLMRKKHE
jgi:hypothetical protein